MIRTNFGTYHPVINFGYFMAIIGFTMFSMHPVFLMISFGTSFLYSVLLNGIKSIKFNFRFMITIIILTAVINPLFTHKGITVLFYLNGNAMTLESIIYGLSAAVLLTNVVLWFNCYNVIMTSDKFVYLFGHILPVLSLVLSMCLRFVPLLKVRFNEISQGQKSIGKDFTGGHIIKRARLMIKKMSILITWSMENAIKTSDSMRARGYGIKGRSSFHLFWFDSRDAMILGFMIVLSLVVLWGCLHGDNNILYYPEILFNPVGFRALSAYVSYFILSLLPMVLDVKEEIRWRLLHSKI